MVTAGVALAVFDIMVVAVVIIVTGTDFGTTLTAVVVGGLGVVGTAVATVVTESDPVVFTVVEAEGCVSTETAES